MTTTISHSDIDTLADDVRASLVALARYDAQGWVMRWRVGHQIREWREQNTEFANRYGQRFVPTLADKVGVSPDVLWMWCRLAELYPSQRGLESRIQACINANIPVVRRTLMPAEERDPRQVGGRGPQTDRILSGVEREITKLKALVEQGVETDQAEQIDGLLATVVQEIADIAQVAGVQVQPPACLSGRQVGRQADRPDMIETTQSVVSVDPDTWSKSMMEAYHGYIRSNPCCVCGGRDDVEIAHFPYTRAVMPPEYQVIPLCRRCHDTQHRQGVKTWWDVQKYTIIYYLQQEIAKLWGRYACSEM